MIMLVIINVCLSIGVVLPYDCSGVLSMCLNGGGNSGVNYLHDWNILSEYYGNFYSNER